MNVILSIKPEFVEKIFSGEKQYEYRKILFKQKVDTVYIYASRPISKIVGEFKIDEILCDTPGNIWKETRCQSGVTRKFFDKYYKGREKAVALKIKECKEYKEAINPDSLIPNFKVPQSFIYIEDKITPQIQGKVLIASPPISGRDARSLLNGIVRFRRPLALLQCHL